MKRKILIAFVGLLEILFLVSSCIPFPQSKELPRMGSGADRHKTESQMFYFSDDSGETRHAGTDILPEGKSLEDVLSVDENTVWALRFRRVITEND